VGGVTRVVQPEAHVSTKALRSPVKWHGGKYYLCPRIIAYFPKHRTFIEPFGGGASVLLNKQPSPVEVYNDLDGAITRLFRVLRDNGEELRRRLILTPYSEVEFNAALEAREPEDDIEQARRDFVRWRMSLGGRGEAFSFTRHRARREMADVVSGFLSTIDNELPRITQRLRSVQILCRPAIDVIKGWDDPDCLFYCDPPYVHETRNHRTTEVYGVEMSETDHRELAAVLRTVKGKVILSGYPSPLYEELYRGWRSVSFEMANHASSEGIKNRMKEMLWFNWIRADGESGLF
jgi:DNA adenine methylase